MIILHHIENIFILSERNAVLIEDSGHEIKHFFGGRRDFMIDFRKQM